MYTADVLLEVSFYLGISFNELLTNPKVHERFMKISGSQKVHVGVLWKSMNFLGSVWSGLAS